MKCLTLDASNHLVLGSELLLGVQVDQVVFLLEALDALYSYDENESTALVQLIVRWMEY